MNRIERLSLFADLRKPLIGYSNTEIENGIMAYCLSNMGHSDTRYSTANAQSIVNCHAILIHHTHIFVL